MKVRMNLALNMLNKLSAQTTFHPSVNQRQKTLRIKSHNKSEVLLPLISIKMKLKRRKSAEEAVIKEKLKALMMIGAIQRRKSLTIMTKIDELVHSNLQLKKKSEMKKVTIVDVVDLI